MPRIPTAAFCRRRDGSRRSNGRTATASGSMPASPPAIVVPSDYDPMLAKVIAHGATRAAALDRLAAALGDTIVIGPRVNTAFLGAIIDHPDFRAGRFDTGFIDRHLKELLATDPADSAQAAASGVAYLLERERTRVGSAGPAEEATSWRSPWAADDGFALGPSRALAFDIVVDGVERQALVAWGAGGEQVSVDGIAAQGADRIIALPDGVAVAGRRLHHVAFKPRDTSGAAPAGEDSVRAPMNGKVIAVLVEPGQQVKLVPASP